MAANYTTVFSGTNKANMVKQFVVDTYDKIASINISQLLPGSTVFVIETSKTYMLNHSYQWKEIIVGGGGGSSGDVIYDGGEETTEPTGRQVVYDGGEEQ